MLPLIVAFIVAFSGISIHMQVIVLAQKAGISIKRYLLFRALHILLIPLFFLF